jgi:hypothetical protein
MIEKTKKNYEDFVKENGFEPRFAYCKVTFLDNGDSMDATFKLSCDEDENDNFIFYYCTGLSDLISLYDEGGVNDFRISGVATFGIEA